MSDAGLSANAARGVKFGSEPASGLNDGDVVAFLDPDSGKPYAVRREEDLREGRGETVFLFGVDLDAAEASVATARTLERLRTNEDAHLEVHAHGDFVGFRAAGANGRLLQATRKGACRLRFHGECFGTWEEWFLDARVAAEARETKWARLTVILRHRRLDKLELRVTLVRLGRAKGAEEALRGSAAWTPARLPAAAAATPGSVPASARSSRRGTPAGSSSRPPLLPGTGAGGTRADVTKEHTSVLHAMSGAVAKEFVVALQREVAARAALEREVAEMHAASEELRRWTLGELERLRTYGQERVDEIAGDTANLRAAAAEARSALSEKTRGTEKAVTAAFARRRRRVVSSRAFEALRAHAAAETRTRRVLMRAAARMQHRCVASALDTWFENVANTKRLRVAAARVASKWRNASVASAFGSWRVAWRRAAMRDGAVAATIARARLAALAPAFRRWLERMAELRARASTRRRADAKFEALARRALARALDAWFDRCENARAKRRRVASGTARLRIRRETVAKRDCFLGWAASGRRARDTRRAAARAYARVGRRVRDGCFSRWRAFTKRNAERSRFVMRTFALSDSIREATCFRAWRGVVEARFKQRAIAMTRVLAAWTRRGVAKAFHTWAEAREERARTRGVASRVAARFASRAASKAFDRWAESTRDARRARQIVARVSARVSLRAQSAAFAAWAFRVVETKRLTRLVARVVGRMARRDLARSFDAWLHGAAETVSARRNETRAVFFRVAFKTKATFATWRATASSEARSRRLTKRAAYRFARRGSASAFATWADHARFARRARLVVANVLERWRRRAVVGAFDAWRDAAAEMRRRRTALARFFARYANARLASAFDGWLDGAAASRRARTVIARTLARWHRRALAGAFDAWAEAATASSLRTQKLAAVVARWTSRDFTKSFNRWARVAEIGRERRSVLARAAAARLLGRRRGDAFRGWASTAAALRRARARVGAILERWLRLRLTAAFDGWRAAARGRIRRRRVARAAASRWTHRLVGGAFDAWLDATLKSRLSLELAGRVISRLTARTQAKAFGAWVANARASRVSAKRSASRLEAVVRRWSRRELRGAWDGWARAVAERARLRTVATRVAARFRRLGAAAAFETWWANGVERPRMARAIVARVCKRHVARAFHAWTENARASARFSLASARAAGVARKLAARARAASFRAWREATKTRAHGWTLARHMLARVLRGATRDAWDAWLAAARETKANEANLKRCLTRKRVAQRWFLRWYWDAFDSDIQVALANILGAGEAAEAEAEGVGATEAGRGWMGMPSAVRGVRAVRRRDGDDESSSDSDTESSDEDMSRASEAVAAQSAADAMLFSAPADPDGGFDVKEAARALARQSAMKSARDPRSLFRRGLNTHNGEGDARASLSESESSETDSPSLTREVRSPPAESYEARVARALREREALAK